MEECFNRFPMIIKDWIAESRCMDPYLVSSCLLYLRKATVARSRKSEVGGSARRGSLSCPLFCFSMSRSPPGTVLGWQCPQGLRCPSSAPPAWIHASSRRFPGGIRKAKDERDFPAVLSGTFPEAWPSACLPILSHRTQPWGPSHGSQHIPPHRPLPVEGRGARLGDTSLCPAGQHLIEKLDVIRSKSIILPKKL